MSNPIEELINGGMGGITAYLTNKTCGEACWYAKEEICRCSCGGKNHGCLKREDGEQPQRTAMIDGVRYKLAAVGKTEMYGEATIINKAAPKRQITSTCAYHWRETEPGAPARVKKASPSQLERWPELKAHLEEITAIKARRHAPIEYMRVWPYLLWVRIDLEEKK